jgi:hypothetical protein
MSNILLLAVTYVLKKRVSYQYLKNNDIISKANLVSAELISYPSTMKILNEGYNGV